MSLGRWRPQQIYLYQHPVDMRKGMDSLALLVKEEMDLNPLDSILFVFTNKSKDKVKLLVWERNGFWTLYKKLLKQRFKWPRWFSSDKLLLPEEQLLQLLDGIDLNGLRPHQKLMIEHFA